MVNILFVYGGRRVQLAELFRQHGCRVFGFEQSARVPLADVAVEVGEGPAYDSPDFAGELREFVRTRAIDLVVPLGCGAMAAVTALDLPCNTAGPPAGTARYCHDKKLFAEVCRERCPEIYPSPEEGEDWVFKPRFGFGSKDIAYGVWWRDGCDGGDDAVVQRRLAGPEFSVDAFFDRYGRLLGASPRERLRVAGGEVMESVTVDRPDLADAVRRLGQALPFRGPVCVQFMADPKDGSPKVIEANTRFGGGATLSVAAGFDMVGATLREFLSGSCPELSPAKPGVYLTRSYRDHVFAPAELG